MTSELTLPPSLPTHASQPEDQNSGFPVICFDAIPREESCKREANTEDNRSLCQTDMTHTLRAHRAFTSPGRLRRDMANPDQNDTLSGSAVGHPQTRQKEVPALDSPHYGNSLLLYPFLMGP